MNLPAASWGVSLLDNFPFSPQAAGNLPCEIKDDRRRTGRLVAEVRAMMRVSS
jgi:hypothetical protein